jgi:hypothetical protein
MPLELEEGGNFPPPSGYSCHIYRALTDFETFRQDIVTMAEWGTPANPATGHGQAFVVDNSEVGNMSILNPAGNPNQSNAGADETGPAASKEDQPRVIASRACLSCRRLKVQ